MGSSLILKGGTTTPKTIEETISVSHSFAVGDVVRFDIDTGAWALAQANNAENSEVVGVIKEVQSGSFKIVYSGYIDLNSRYGGTTNPVLFLSADTAGALSESPPSAIGTVVKPVLTRKSGSGTGEFIVMNYLGTQIGGSSTVAIDEIQPVGTIVPFAGSTIPDSWLACDGASYAISTYPNLYAKLQNSSGDRAPAYGYVATLTGTNVSSVLAAGDYIQYKADANAFTGTGSPFAGAATNASLLAIVLSVTSTTAVVQVIPTYSSTTKNFTISNTVFGGGAFASSETGTGNYRAYSTSSAFKGVSLTITSAAITHFNTPDMRGRFALGVNTSALPSSGDLELDGSNNSAISGIYSLGSEGGQEATVASTGVASGTNAYVTSAASGGLIANLPPYTVVRYIIKAAPYTRAAIIDGVDIPYDQLLVGDLRSGLLRNAGVGEDLVFKTNTSVSTTGTERMRLTNGGNLGIGTTTPTAAVEVIGGVSASGAMSGSRLSVSGGITAGTDIVSTSGNIHLLNASSAGVATKTGPLHLAVATNSDNGAIANDKIGLTVKANKNVGVNGIYDPSSPLSVLSESGSGGIRVWRSASSGVGSKETAYAAMDVDGSGAAFASWGGGYRFTTGATGSTDTVTNRLVIKTDGKVGIGTSEPSTTLNIVGDVATTTNGLVEITNTNAGGKGLRVRAGDAVGNAVLMDVTSSNGSTTHFAVREDGIQVGSAVMSAPAGSAPIFHIRAFAVFEGRGDSGNCTLLSSGNVAQIRRGGANGQYEVTMSTAMSNTNYGVVVTGHNTSDAQIAVLQSITSNIQFVIKFIGGGAAGGDPVRATVMVIG